QAAAGRPDPARGFRGLRGMRDPPGHRGGRPLGVHRRGARRPRRRRPPAARLPPPGVHRPDRPPINEGGRPMSLGPQAKAYLEQQAALGLPPTEQRTPAEARTMAEEGAAALFGPSEDVHAVEDFEVEGVPVRLYAPAGDESLPIVVYLHGGGWAIGS